MDLREEIEAALAKLQEQELFGPRQLRADDRKRNLVRLVLMEFAVQVLEKQESQK